ncbi:MAG: hypothetical protein ACJ75Z_12740 [Solirubrobacterales bacterium]
MTKVTRHLLTVLACAAALAGVAGCGGGSDDQGTARDTAQAYVDARNSGDAAKTCDLLSDQLKQQVGASNCEAFIKEQSLGAQIHLTLIGVQENGDRATATIESAGEATQATGKSRHLRVHVRVSLARQDDEWKITGLGGGGGD